MAETKTNKFYVVNKKESKNDYTIIVNQSLSIAEHKSGIAFTNVLFIFSAKLWKIFLPLFPSLDVLY